MTQALALSCEGDTSIPHHLWDPLPLSSPSVEEYQQVLLVGKQLSGSLTNPNNIMSISRLSSVFPLKQSQSWNHFHSSIFAYKANTLQIMPWFLNGKS